MPIPSPVSPGSLTALPLLTALPPLATHLSPRCQPATFPLPRSCHHSYSLTKSFLVRNENGPAYSKLTLPCFLPLEHQPTV